MKITDFKSGTEFQEFIEQLFHAEYPDFQSVSSEKDKGIDGLYWNEKSLYQIYYPDRDKYRDEYIKGKIRRDLKKAEKIIREKGLNIKNWCFITPINLTSEQILYLRKNAEEHGLSGLSIGHSKLSELLAKSSNRHIRRNFPNLSLPDIETLLISENKKIDSIINYLGIKEKAYGPQSPSIIPISKQNVLDDENIKKSLEAWSKGDIRNSQRFANEAYFSGFGAVKLQAIIILILTEEDHLQKPTYYISLCDEGVSLARRLSDKSSEAVITGHKARFINDLNFTLVFEIYTNYLYSTVGYPTLSPARRYELSQKIDKYSKEMDKLANLSQQLAVESKDASALAHVKITLGSTSGLNYFLPKQLGLDTGEIEQKTVRFFLEAKEIYENTGDKEGIANALHNLANNLRSFGRTAEAKKYALMALKIAKEIKYIELIRKAKELLSKPEFNK